MKPNRRFLSLRFKMLLIIVLRITVVFIVIYLWLYTFLGEISTRTLQADVETVLASGAASLHDDALTTLLASSATGLPPLNDERYGPIRAWFEQVAGFNPQAAPYVYYQPAPGKLAVLADSLYLKDPSNPQAYAPGAELPLTAGSFLPAGLEGESLDLGVRSIRGREAVAGAIPIRDSNGKVVAALAVDLPPSAVADRELAARANVLMLLSLVYVLLSFSVWFITGNMTRTLRALDQASQRIGEGDYAPITIKPGVFDDEITHLTDTLNLTVEKIRGREESLRKQVEKLSIQVDQARREKAVSEVVESDFFRDLQTKAKTLREHHDEDESGAGI